MGIETLPNDQLKELGDFHKDIAAWWAAETGDGLRKVMADMTEGYMAEIMNGDPHAYRAVRAMNDLANALGDSALYVRAVRVEFERRYSRNGG